jgi:hypothetical protein
MIVRVTKKHILHGECGSLCKCPVALAIHDAANCGHVNVTTARVIVDGTQVKAPRSVSRFVQRFDLGEQVKPFAFRLSI